LIQTQSKITSSVQVAEVVTPMSITDHDVHPAVDTYKIALVTAIFDFSGLVHAKEIAFATHATRSISIFFLLSFGSKFLFFIIVL